MPRLLRGKEVAVDAETTGLNPYRGDCPFAISMSNLDLEHGYVEFPVDPFTRKVLWDTSRGRKDLARVAEVLEDEKVVKVFHNAKFDTRMIYRNFGIRVRGRIEETMFMAWCCNSLEPSLKLKPLADRYAGIDTEDLDLLHKAAQYARRKGKKLGWKIFIEENDQPLAPPKKKGVIEPDYWLPAALARLHPQMARPGDELLCRDYALKDTDRTLLLKAFYFEMMEELEVRKTYEFEMRQLWPVIVAMEDRGVRIHPEINKVEIEDCVNRCRVLSKELVKKSWPDFNMNSPVQLRKLLYERLRLPVNDEHRTDTGLPGTHVDALMEFEDHPVVGLLMKYRSAVKAHGYFCKYKRLMDRDHVTRSCMILHSDFRQLGPATGRFSCANPNLQQVTSIESSRSADPIDARHAFGPRPGYIWLHNDYKAMEVRVFADVSQEPNMLRAIAEGRDIHDEVCDRGWGGKDNPAGIKECIHVLGLDGSELSRNEQLAKWWDRWGLKPGGWKKLTQTNRVRLASEFLAEFNWSIVRAQESIGKKVTKNKGKMVTFAKIYGGGPNAVKGLLHVTFEEAQEFLFDYERAFPRIPEFMYEITEQARADEFILTRWGRRLCVDPDKAYRACNYLVQGSSADLLKSAMVKCHRFFLKEKLDAHLIMSIHDELVFEVREEELTKTLVRRICGFMEDTDGNLSVPMPTDPSIVTHSWDLKTKIKV